MIKLHEIKFKSERLTIRVSEGSMTVAEADYSTVVKLFRAVSFLGVVAFTVDRVELTKALKAHTKAKGLTYSVSPDLKQMEILSDGFTTRCDVEVCEWERDFHDAAIAPRTLSEELGVQPVIDHAKALLKACRSRHWIPRLAGVWLRKKGDAVASDGHRLLQVPGCHSNEDLLLPREAVEIMSQISPVMVCKYWGGILMRTGETGGADWAYVETNPSVEPMDFDTVIPDPSLREQWKAPLTLTKTVRRLKSFAGRDGILAFRPDALECVSKKAQASLQGPSVPVGLNAAYVLDALSACGDGATWSFDGDGRPVTLEHPSGGIYLVMPARL